MAAGGAASTLALAAAVALVLALGGVARGFALHTRLSVGPRVFRHELGDRGGSDRFRRSLEVIPPRLRPTAIAEPWAEAVA